MRILIVLMLLYSSIIKAENTTLCMEVIGKECKEVSPFIPTSEQLRNTSGIYDTGENNFDFSMYGNCLLYTSPSPRDTRESRMPSSA